jgi:hypothetical protein
MNTDPAIAGPLPALNLLVLVLVAVVPVPPKRGLRWSWLGFAVCGGAAVVLAFPIMWIANLAITLAYSERTPSGWRADPHAAQWTMQYALCAACAVLLCLAVRLPFTRGVRPVLAAIPLAIAVGCGAGAIIVLSSS